MIFANIALLREKYPQYREMALERSPLIRLTIAAHRAWGELGAAPGGPVARALPEDLAGLFEEPNESVAASDLPF